MSDPVPTGYKRLLTPTQLNALARSLLEDAFPLVEVEGEISNLARPASGHLYCSLKDRNAQVRCALFKPKTQWLRFKPADGQLVRARGRLTLYEPRGDYQLVLEHMEPAGEGALQRAFDELKLKLQSEGLFDASRKRPLPARIQRLGVLTSPSGAAIHDVLTVLRRRFPLLQVELLPIPVQGADCPGRALTMLQRADASGRYDVLLLTRGGGSLEDLHGFNDESLARAIAACATPVVSAIGHEVDFTIADFVADLRCPTPSAAAEALSPDCEVLRQQLHRLADRHQQGLQRRLQTLAQRADQVHARLQIQRPAQRLQRASERADELRLRLSAALDRRIAQPRQRIDSLHRRLRTQHPAAALDRRRDQLAKLRTVMQGRMAQSLQSSTRVLHHLARTLHAVSPLATMERGYAILRDGPDLLRSVHQARAGQDLQALMRDGELQVRVVATPSNPTKS